MSRSSASRTSSARRSAVALPQLVRDEREGERADVVRLPFLGQTFRRRAGTRPARPPSRPQRLRRTSWPSARSPEHLGRSCGDMADRCRYAVATIAVVERSGRGSAATSGSSHSPKWKPVSQRYRLVRRGDRSTLRPGPGAAADAALPSRTRPSAASTGAARRSASTSPYARQSSHGTSTAASPQPAEPAERSSKTTPDGRFAARVGDHRGHAPVGPLVGRQVAQPPAENAARRPSAPPCRRTPASRR